MSSELLSSTPSTELCLPHGKLLINHNLLFNGCELAKEELMVSLTQFSRGILQGLSSDYCHQIFLLMTQIKKKSMRVIMKSASSDGELAIFELSK